MCVHVCLCVYLFAVRGSRTEKIKLPFSLEAVHSELKTRLWRFFPYLKGEKGILTSLITWTGTFSRHVQQVPSIPLRFSSSL